VPDDVTTRSTEREALTNVRTVLQLCAAGKIRCSEKTARPSAASVTTIAQALQYGDFYPDEAIAAFAWPLLVQAGGLARLAGGRLELTPKGHKALSDPPENVLRQIWGRWPRHAPIDEFSRVDQIKGQRGTNVLTAAKPRREAVAAALDLCPADEWIDVDKLFLLMRKEGPHFSIARSERALWRLYLVDPAYGSLGYEGYGDWPIVEGRYALAVLFEYAATLGLIDVEYTAAAHARDDYRDNWGADDLDSLSRYDGLLAVRLNALGAYATGRTSSYAPPAPSEPVPAIQVLANFDVVATADLPATDRLTLDAYAARISDRVWTLSAESLLTAVDAGRSVDDLATFLDERAVHDVPETVARLLTDVSARTRQLRDLGMHRVVECADATVATLLGSDPTLRAHFTRIGDRHLLLAPGAEARVRTALRKLGYALGPGTDSTRKASLT
jgi:hypothetical protein